MPWFTIKETEINRKSREQITSGLAVIVKTLNRGKNFQEESDVVGT